MVHVVDPQVGRRGVPTMCQVPRWSATSAASAPCGHVVPMRLLRYGSPNRLPRAR